MKRLFKIAKYVIPCLLVGWLGYMYGYQNGHAMSRYQLYEIARNNLTYAEDKQKARQEYEKIISIPAIAESVPRAFVDYRDLGYATPMEFAITNHEYDDLEIMLAGGANPNIRRSYGRESLLSYAKRFNRHKAVELLIAYGASEE